MINNKSKSAICCNSVAWKFYIWAFKFLFLKTAFDRRIKLHSFTGFFKLTRSYLFLNLPDKLYFYWRKPFSTHIWEFFLVLLILWDQSSLLQTNKFFEVKFFSFLFSQFFANESEPIVNKSSVSSNNMEAAVLANWNKDKQIQEIWN